MTSARRGFIWIAAIAGFGLVASFSAASALWRAGAEAAGRAERHRFLAENRETALASLDEWRAYAARLQAGAIAAASPAQAEALLREEIAERARAAGATLSSVQNRLGERGDPANRLRLRIVLTAPQPSLPDVLAAIRGAAPMVVIDASEVRLAGGIRRPGSAAASTQEPLELSLDVSAVWKEPVGDGQSL